MAVIDLSSLVQSEPFRLKPTGEVRVDLILRKRPSAPDTVLYGYVLSGGDACPVEGAVVKVMDREYNPVAHAYADQEGRYDFCHVLQPGKYKLTAAAAGYLAAPTIDFILRTGFRRKINVSIEAEPSARQSVLYGNVLDFEGGIPVENASVVLLDETEKPVAETHSNESGQYLIAAVRPGYYTIAAHRTGYRGVAVTVQVPERQLIRTDLWLRAEYPSCAGTVSGIVMGRCECGDVFAAERARVGLYMLEESGEILQATTVTNDEGLYLFGGLRSGGYRVKAKLDGGYEYSQEFRVP